MSASPVCPRCGERLVVRPGATAQAWCPVHGAVSPLHYTTLLAHDAIAAVTTDARVPAWVPDPVPAGWSVTGLAWAGEPGARAIAVDCAGPAPLGAVPTDDGRAAFVGESYGVWLWLVMWPASAAWLLAEQLELLDLRDRLYPDLPLGPPSEHLLPGH